MGISLICFVKMVFSLLEINIFNKIFFPQQPHHRGDIQYIYIYIYIYTENVYLEYTFDAITVFTMENRVGKVSSNFS